MTSTLAIAFACACQLTAAGSSPDLRTTLVNRLYRYYELRGSNRGGFEKLSLTDLQTLTAEEALNIVSDVHHMLDQDTRAEGQEQDVGGALGTRDLARLRTLISIVFKWGVENLLSHCLQLWPTKLGELVVVSPEDVLKQYSALVAMTNRLISMIFPSSSGPPSVTHITATINGSHLIDLLRPCLALGWLPKSLSTRSIVACDSLRPLTLRLLSFAPPSQSIVALGGVLSSKPVPSLHMRRICTLLLGKQITRIRGVNGLCVAVFGDEDVSGDEPSLEKLEHISRVLLTVPQGIQPQDFYRAITHQMLSLLSENIAPMHKRAVAFAVSHMLTTEESLYPHAEIGSQFILSSLHNTLIPTKDTALKIDITNMPPASILLPLNSISVLATLVANMDPHPTSISRLLSPVVPALYSLLYHLDQNKTSDPVLRDSVHGLLVTWGKIIEKSEGLNCLWSISQSNEIYWKVGLDGNIYQASEPNKALPLSFFTTESLKEAENSGSLDVDANIMNFYPDPVHYVRFLKELDRTDISSDLFVNCLESYREQKSSNNADPLETLLTMQIVMQIQKQLSTGPSSSNLLCKPAHMLLFIKHVLESSAGGQNGCSSQKKKLVLDQCTKIVPQPLIPSRETEDAELVDSDDDVLGPEVISPDDEMIETAINLLLSILEANRGLSARTMPILNDIYSLLDPFSRETPANIRAVAREARIVMTARLASTSTEGSLQSSQEEFCQEMYQKALKLLQDPVLPVRAHGLLLLRQLITQSKGEVNSALIPAILSIFLQAVQDDESYLFLNAVQGLAAMVESYGKDVLKALVREYTDDLVSTSGGELSQHELDVRIRVGEALGIVIRRMGTTLGIYSDFLIPQLFRVVRSSSVPTVLRTSSLSLLADCVNTYTLAILPYVTDIAETMVDFLHIKAVLVTDRSLRTQSTVEVAPLKEIEKEASMDSQPMSTNSKFPPLRRAALHFLSLLIRSMTEYVYDKSSTGINWPIMTLRRMKSVLAYIASTDEDNIVRIMAREAGEELQQLQQALFGL